MVSALSKPDELISDLVVAHRFEPEVEFWAAGSTRSTRIDGVTPTMKAFVLIVTFAATDPTDATRTERIASFDDYQACVSAARTLYSRQHWECAPAEQGSRGR
jgi:hypothetical protein